MAGGTVGDKRSGHTRARGERSAGHQRRTRKKAGELLERLDDDAFREAVRFTQAQIDALDAIADGNPPRNAMAILKALDMKAAYAYAKPKVGVELGGALSIKVVTGIEREPGDDE